LGEFSALVATGALSFRDALRIVRRRGQEMLRAADANPGGMAAVIGLDDGTVETLCDEVDGVWAANFNSPGQIVVSGVKPALEEFGAKARAAGAKRVISLPVSGAFHSPLMVDARDGLAAALGEIEVRDPEFPVVANSVASPVTGADRARELLIEQLTSPVRWVECVESMVGTRPDGWLELGPGKVLMGLMRRIDRSANVRAVGDPGDLDGIQGFLEEGHDA